MVYKLGRKMETTKGTTMTYTTITARDLITGDITKAAADSGLFGKIKGEIKDMIRDGIHTLIEWADGSLTLIHNNTFVMVATS